MVFSNIPCTQTMQVSGLIFFQWAGLEKVGYKIHFLYSHFLCKTPFDVIFLTLLIVCNQTLLLKFGSFYRRVLQIFISHLKMMWITTIYSIEKRTVGSICIVLNLWLQESIPLWVISEHMHDMCINKLWETSNLYLIL